MEQKQENLPAPLPNLKRKPVISKGEFFKQITVDRWDRFALVFFFILNTLH